ncbi:MAG: leucyl aminopeptidase family protein [Desulfurococcales archaeon]|nr:leucyl aminopeptidase family protein [Desulfurococcales archaeon]
MVEPDYSRLKADLVGVLVFKGEETLPKEVEALNTELGGGIKALLGTPEFTCGVGESVLIYGFRGGVKRVLVVGGGDKGSANAEVLRTYGAVVVKRAKELGLRSVAITARFLSGKEESLRAIAEGAELANYVWGAKKDLRRVEELVIAGPEEVEGAERILKEVGVVSEAVSLGRDLANGPAEEVNPETFEERVREAFKGLPVTLKVLHEEDLRREGLNGIIAVGKGSAIPPRLVIIEYRGAGEGEPWIAVVGKGVCFDAGGLDLKTAASMFDMKFDKAGAAYAVAVAYAAAKLGLKVNLVALAPLVENLPSGSSYKPLDIIKMYNGLTVEVHNTDAEGRLILADALAYAAKNYSPEVMIDMATLTGSIISALGCHAAGLFSNDEGLKEEIMKAAEETGEKVWPFPMWEEYYEDIKSDFADIKNIGVGRAAGAIIGAVFLSKFVGDTKWAHLDIAGVANTQQEGPKKPYYPKGATGFGVRLLLQFLRSKERSG